MVIGVPNRRADGGHPISLNVDTVGRLLAIVIIRQFENLVCLVVKALNLSNVKFIAC